MSESEPFGPVGRPMLELVVPAVSIASSAVERLDIGHCVFEY